MIICIPNPDRLNLPGFSFSGTVLCLTDRMMHCCSESFRNCSLLKNHIIPNIAFAPIRMYNKTNR